VNDDPRMRRRLNGTVSAILLICAGVYDYHNGFRFSKSAANKIANRVFQLRLFSVELGLPKTTRVEVYALSPRENRASGHRDWDRLAHATLSGDELADFKRLWLGLDFDLERSMPCHNPAYRLQFYRGEVEEFDTTVSWDCANITLWDTGYGFDAKSADAQALYAKLKSACPAPPTGSGS
jgi:hypothetical protein